MHRTACGTLWKTISVTVWHLRICLSGSRTYHKMASVLWLTVTTLYRSPETTWIRDLENGKGNMQTSCTTYSNSEKNNKTTVSLELCTTKNTSASSVPNTQIWTTTWDMIFVCKLWSFNYISSCNRLNLKHKSYQRNRQQWQHFSTVDDNLKLGWYLEYSERYNWK